MTPGGGEATPGGAAVGIIAMDDDLVVVDKPSGMPSVPARTPLDPPDVATVLAARCGPLEAAHRLDRDTSGLLVLARSREARARVGRAFEEGLVDKRYLAVVHAAPPVPAGMLALPLAADLERPPRQRIDPILGRRAATRWRTLAAGRLDGREVTLVELTPLTGRGHQLRVHLAWLGCPIVGDRLYGPDDAAAIGLALHAAAITLPHPRDGRRLALTCPVPDTPPWHLVAAGSRAGRPQRAGGDAGPGA